MIIMNRKEIIEKAKKLKYGVGSKMVGMSYSKDDPINKMLLQNKKIKNY